jgi:hypothetical protein
VKKLGILMSSKQGLSLTPPAGGSVHGGGRVFVWTSTTAHALADFARRRCSAELAHS